MPAPRSVQGVRAARRPGKAASEDVVCLAVADFPIGRIAVEGRATAVVCIRFVSADTALAAPQTPLLRRALQELAVYFQNPGRLFTVPLAQSGTPFRRRVWNRLWEIPPGECRTYGQLAAECGSSPRAVGQACAANRIPLIIPCHRVVSSVGLGGYSAAHPEKALWLKQWLLNHEAVLCRSSWKPGPG